MSDLQKFERWIAKRGYRTDSNAPLGCLMAGDRIVTVEEIIDFGEPPKPVRRVLMQMLGFWT